MKNNYFKFLAPILAFFFVLIVIICIVLINSGLALSNPLRNISSETDSAPSIVVYGTLYTKGETVPISQLCKERNKNYHLYDVFCVVKGRAYFVFADRNEASRIWAIGSINLSTKEFYEHSRFRNAQEVYHHDHSSPYKDRNGYYLDGKIILNDKMTVWTYDIDSEVANSCSYEKYDFPYLHTTGEAINAHGLSVKAATLDESFTLHEMSQNSESIARIAALDKKKTWNGESYLQGFFSDNCVQEINGYIYAIGSCLNYWGGSYAVILQYMPKDGVWQYVTSTFADDSAHISCYLVPSY